MNPYYCYSISFGTALVSYWLHWSELYPELQWPLLIFLYLMILLMLLVGMRWKQWIVLKDFQPVDDDRKPWIITLFIYLLWSFDFLYEGGIP